MADSFWDQFYDGAAPEDDGFGPPDIDYEVVTPTGVGEIAERGYGVGIKNIATDLEYFKGMFNTLVGDDDEAAKNIENARFSEQQTSGAFGKLQTFEEFINNPSFGGFINQVTKTTSQLTPYMVTTIGSGLGGAIATGGLKIAVGASSKHVANRIVRDSLKKKVKGTATPEEERLLETAYQLAKANSPANKLSMTGGAKVGMYGQEFTSMSGSNFGENLEAGVDPYEAALRSAGLAVPQAFIGLKGEELLTKTLFKDLSSIATKRSVKEGSTFSLFAKEIAKSAGRSGVTEMAAETAQESLSIANRFNVDKDYTSQDALLRVGESAFAGFFGGGVMGGAGGTAVGAVRGAGNIMSKAKDYVEKAREYQVNDQINKEQYRSDSMGFTTAEPQSSINAQIRSALDKETSRHSVWVAGEKPEYNASPEKTNQVEIEGQLFYTRFIPGRGTIITKNYDIAEEVAKSEASDESLAIALQYGTKKPIDADVSIEVLDADGNLVWQEAANESTVAEAYKAAEKQVPKGGSIRRITIEEALENRTKLFEKEQGPQVRNIDIPEDVREKFMDQDITENEAIMEDEGQSDEEFNQVDTTGVDSVVEYKNVGNQERYQAGTGKIYKGTGENRARFAEAFAEVDLPGMKDEYTAVDFEQSAFKNMSDGLLKTATRIKRENPETDVFVQLNDDGTYSIMQGVPPEQTQYYDSRFETPDAPARSELNADSSIGAIFDGATNESVQPSGASNLATTLSQFVRQAVNKAASSDYAKKFKTRSKKNNGWKNKKESELVKVNGRAVNLIDLVKEGQRMVSVEERQSFEEGGPQTAQRAGFIRIMAAILEQGGNVTIGGLDISQQVLADIGSLEQNLKDANNVDFDVTENLDSEVISNTTSDQSQSNTNNVLQRLMQERKAYNRAYSEFKKKEAEGDKSATAPEKSPLLQILDVPAGFQDGKTVSLGKLLLAGPLDPKPRDREYEVIDSAGQLVLAGNRDQVIEYVESIGDSAETSIYRPARTLKDGTELEAELVEDIYDEPTLGFDGELGYSNDSVDVGSRIMDSEQENVFGLSNPGATVPKQKIFGLGRDNLTSRIVNVARKKLRLEKATSVFDIDKILSEDTESQREYNAMFSDPKVAAYVKKVAQELRDNPEGGGRYIGFNDAHIILVDKTSMKNELHTVLTVAHELGHALYREQQNATLQNPVLYNRLIAAFEKARDADGAPVAYKGKRGFEEWYSDQVSYWAQKQYQKEIKNTSPKVGDKVHPQVKGVVLGHFKQLVRKLREFHKELSRDLKRRVSKAAYSTEFDGYMDEVLKRNRAYSINTDNSAGARVAGYKDYAKVAADQAAVQKENPNLVSAIKNAVTKMVRSKNFDPIYNLMFTSDSRLRKVGGNKIADMFYGRAQDSKGVAATRLGALKAMNLEANALVNKLEKGLSIPLDSTEGRAAIDEAFTDADTDTLSKNAQAVRKWFDSVYDDYIAPSNTDIGRQKNYAPVTLKLSEIHANPEKFIELIAAANPDDNLKAIKDATERLVAYQQAVIDDKPIIIDGVDPAADIEKALMLTRNVKRETLNKAGYLEDSDVAILRYITHITKRVEFNRHTKDAGGNSVFEEELRKLNKDQQKEVKEVVDSYFGYNTKPIGPTWRAVNSIGTVVQIFAILPFAVLGSIPELAGPVIASKEFGSITQGFKEIAKTVRDREEAERLSRDLGLVTSASVASALMSQSEMDWMDQNSRKITEGFFRVIGLDTFTKFTRYFALNMGIRFITEHSDPNTARAFSARYLKELGITAKDVAAWEKTERDFNTPEGAKVRRALQRFAESATLRPNAAERPVWASDPRFALVWQLKGFFYSYGKVLLAGAKREASARLEGASGKDASVYAAMAGSAGIFALMGIATLPLAMIGMELREYAKFGFAAVIPGIDSTQKDYFRTDSLSWFEYLSAAFSRSFAAGPVSIGHQMVQASDWGRGAGGALAVGLGPTAETLHRMFTDGFSSTITNRVLPTGLL